MRRSRSGTSIRWGSDKGLPSFNDERDSNTKTSMKWMSLLALTLLCLVGIPSFMYFTTDADDDIDNVEIDVIDVRKVLTELPPEGSLDREAHERKVERYFASLKKGGEDNRSPVRVCTVLQVEGFKKHAHGELDGIYHLSDKDLKLAAPIFQKQELRLSYVIETKQWIFGLEKELGTPNGFAYKHAHQVHMDSLQEQAETMWRVSLKGENWVVVRNIDIDCIKTIDEDDVDLKTSMLLYMDAEESRDL